MLRPAFFSRRICSILGGVLVVACSPAPPPVLAAFTDVTVAAGLPEAALTCAVFRDFDHDGWPDLLLAPSVGVDSGATATLALFTGGPGGTFTRHDLDFHARLVGQCAAADFDRDGWLDIAVVAGFDRVNDHRGTTVLFHNKGSPGTSFEKVTGPLAPDTGFDVSALTFLDADGDGWPDLVAAYHPLRNGSSTPAICEFAEDNLVCRPLPTSPTGAPKLFLNREGKAFEEVSTFATATNSNSVTPFDFDGDGRMDVFVCNEFDTNQFYRNKGGGVWEEMLDGTAAHAVNMAMGVAFNDFNGDGRTDFYVADYGTDEFYVGSAAALVDESRASGVVAKTHGASSWSPVVGDWNLDGLPDLFVPASMRVTDPTQLLDLPPPEETPPQYDLVFSNQAGAPFVATEVAHRTRFISPGMTLAATADYDHDGRLDVVVVYARDAAASELRLEHNTTPAVGHWFGVQLRTADHRDFAGAVVLLDEPGRTGPSQWRAVGSDGLGISMDSAHFGLGTRTSVDAVTVRWPGGLTQRVAGPFPADQQIIIERPGN